MCTRMFSVLFCSCFKISPACFVELLIPKRLASAVQGSGTVAGPGRKDLGPQLSEVSSGSVVRPQETGVHAGMGEQSVSWGWSRVTECRSSGNLLITDTGKETDSISR